MIAPTDVERYNSQAARWVDEPATAAAAAAALEGGDARGGGGGRHGGGVRGGVLLLPLRRGEFPSPGNLQGPRGAVPASAEKTAAPEDAEGRAEEAHAPPLLVRVLRRR